jgi:hypothetical protein
MPQVNNDVANDTDGQHIERCETLEIGIDTHGVTLSFTAADITKIKTYCTDQGLDAHAGQGKGRCR